MSSTSDLYQFRMSLFDHVKPEEFLLFVRNFQTTLTATGTLVVEVKVQCLCTIVCGEAVHQFDVMYSDVENLDISLNMYYLLRGFAWHFPLQSCFHKKSMHCEAV